MLYLSCKEISEISDISEKHIWRNALQGKYGEENDGFIYTNGRGRGGKQLKIALSSLPTDIQEAYYKRLEIGAIQSVEAKSDEATHCTDSQSKKANFIKSVIDEYLYLRESGETEGCCMNDFVEAFNSKNPDMQITVPLLSKWITKYNKDGYNALIDRRGYSKKGFSSIPDEAWNFFKSLWLRETRPSIASCYEMTVSHFPTIKLPCLNTFKYQIDTSIPKAAKVYYRLGKKAFNDNFAATCIRDLTSMSSNGFWVADHHIFDVLVNKDGKIGRPWMSAWQDLRSKKLLGYVINMVSNPNANIVIDSFAHTVEQFGIPECVLLDNGKDYKAFDMFNNENFLSISNRLKISVINANPYNAKSKPIERFFKTLEEKYCKFFSSYIGNDPKKRPEKMALTNEKVLEKGVAMDYETFSELVEKIVNDYNNSPHSGNGMDGRTPNEVYQTSFKKPLRLAVDEDGVFLSMLFLRATKSLTVGKNGVRVKIDSSGYKYFDSDELIRIRGKKVIVHYRADEPDKVYVHDVLDRYLCTARTVKYSTQSRSENDIAAIKDTQHKNRILRQIVKEHQPTSEDANISTYLEERSKSYANLDLSSVSPIPCEIPESMREEEFKKAGDEAFYMEKKNPSAISVSIDEKFYEYMRANKRKEE